MDDNQCISNIEMKDTEIKEKKKKTKEELYAYRREWYRKNKEKEKEKNHQRYEQNKEYFKEKMNERYEQKKDEHLVYNKEISKKRIEAYKLLREILNNDEVIMPQEIKQKASLIFV